MQVEFTKEQELFHALISAYMAARAYTDACASLSSQVPTHTPKGLPMKGNKSFIAITKENEQRSLKHIKTILEHLNKDPNVAKSLEGMFATFQANVQAIVELSPTGQNRVLNLIEKIKKDQVEIDFWNSLKLNNE